MPILPFGMPRLCLGVPGLHLDVPGLPLGVPDSTGLCAEYVTLIYFFFQKLKKFKINEVIKVLKFWILIKLRLQFV